MAEAVAETSIRTLLDNLDAVANTLDKPKVADAVKKAIETVKAAVIGLAKIVEEQKGKTEDLAKTVEEGKVETKKLNDDVRKHSDEIDHQKQKQLKGKIVISSVAKEGKPSLIKTDEGLAGKDLKEHVSELITKKYSITIKKEEIDTCYRPPKGGIVIIFFNTSAGSAFQKLATDIKSAKGQEHNLYFNFMLTKRRSHLLFEVRKMKQTKAIFKYYSDEDGNISMKVNQTDKKSEKLTNIRTKNTSMLKVMSVDEVHQKVQELKQ